MTRLLCCLALLAACTVDPATTPDDDACGDVAPDETWSGAGGGSITIVATNPAPPARFTNWWAVTVEDRAGSPMIDPSRLVVSAFMPEHGHSSPTTPTVTYEPDGLVVGPLELWMPGLWEVRFDVDGDRVVVPVCIDE